jgi:hypothetical protein
VDDAISPLKFSACSVMVTAAALIASAHIIIKNSIALFKLLLNPACWFLNFS